MTECKTCGKSTKNKKFCSRSCSATYNNKKKYGESLPFIYYVRICKKRAKRKEFDFDLTAEYLYNLFMDQNGRCAKTQVPLVLNSKAKKGKDTSPYYASVDRIDNKKGYTQDNVQFLSLGVNYMKNKFSDKSLDEFIFHIKNGR